MNLMRIKMKNTDQFVHDKCINISKKNFIVVFRVAF